MKPNFIKKIFNIVEKHSPEILITLGIAGVGVGTVMIAKATLNAEPVLERHDEQLTNIKRKDYNAKAKQENRPTVADSEDFHIITKEDLSDPKMRKEIAVVYKQTTSQLIKLYFAPVGVMTISLACIIFSNKILNRRNVALASAYATLDACFKDYRKQIVEKYGEDVDTEIRYGLKVKKDKEGNKNYIVTEKTMSGRSQYAKFFDELSTQWMPDAEYNKMFLLQIQSWANMRLQTEGKLFLNEVYKALGLAETKAGQIVGWVYDPNNDKTDSFVQFLDINDPSKKYFIDGSEKSVLLDFNVDGVIWDKLVW